jgi:formate hydrogenlyase subunit 3/multisubunit Na+/H+ antiporter MnhD subunit
MRNLFALLALIGLAGIALGVLAIVRAAPGPTGPLGFTYENYGGPGSMLAGLVMLATSLYLRAYWKDRRD